MNYRLVNDVEEKGGQVKFDPRANLASVFYGKTKLLVVKVYGSERDRMISQADYKTTMSHLWAISNVAVSDSCENVGITDLDSVGYNMIANMERNLSQIRYDEKTGLIIGIPSTATDVGYGHDYIKNPLFSVLESMTAAEVYKLLKNDLNGIGPDGKVIPYKNYIGAVASINADFTQDQFNALVGLRYNLGNLGVVDGLLPYLESGIYTRSELKSIVNSYYNEIIIANPANEKYRDGWYNRTEKMLDIFFDGNYGYMPIDAVNGKVVL